MKTSFMSSKDVAVSMPEGIRIYFMVPDGFDEHRAQAYIAHYVAALTDSLHDKIAGIDEAH